MLNNLLGRVVEKGTSLLPPRIAARVDLLRPGLANGFGPFNGQARREAIVRSLLDALPPDLVIETGTYRGTTTELLHEITKARILTIESSRRYYEYSRRRLAISPRVRAIHGDSVREIRRIASSPGHDRRARVFAYLDAHWSSILPARYEILELLSGWDEFCAVIDDFKVPGDPGYSFAEYGPGAVLDGTLFEGLPFAGVSCFYPSVTSADETGHCCGWVVLGRGPALVDQLARTDGLAIADRWTGTAVSSGGEPD